MLFSKIIWLSVFMCGKIDNFTLLLKLSRLQSSIIFYFYKSINIIHFVHSWDLISCQTPLISVISDYVLQQRFSTWGMSHDFKGYSKKLFFAFLYSKLIFEVYEIVVRGQGVLE